MSYNLQLLVARDIKQILTTDFAQDIIFTPPGGSPITISGYASKHSIDVNEIGFVSVNMKKGHVTVTEQTLLAAGYTTRDGNDSLITFEGHLVTYTDASGRPKTYLIQKGGGKFDEATGMIILILGNYKPA